MQRNCPTGSRREETPRAPRRPRDRPWRRLGSGRTRGTRLGALDKRAARPCHRDLRAVECTAPDHDVVSLLGVYFGEFGAGERFPALPRVAAVPQVRRAGRARRAARPGAAGKVRAIASVREGAGTVLADSGSVRGGDGVGGALLWTVSVAVAGIRAAAGALAVAVGAGRLRVCAAVGVLRPTVRDIHAEYAAAEAVLDVCDRGQVRLQPHHRGAVREGCAVVGGGYGCCRRPGATVAVRVAVAGGAGDGVFGTVAGAHRAAVQRLPAVARGRAVIADPVVGALRRLPAAQGVRGGRQSTQLALQRVLLRALALQTHCTVRFAVGTEQRARRTHCGGAGARARSLAVSTHPEGHGVGAGAPRSVPQGVRHGGAPAPRLVAGVPFRARRLSGAVAVRPAVLHGDVGAAG
eukprot:ctg_178.g139